jgi:hypothetical protein
MENTTNNTMETTAKQKGRPVVAGSARQLRLAKQQEKIKNGGELKKGRPTVAGSARQKRLEERAAKLAAGEAIKRGRPKMKKEEAAA